MLNDQQLQNTLAKPSIAWLCRSAKACNCHFKSMTKFISFLVPFPYFLPCWRMGLLFWAIKILAKWFPSPDVKPRKIKLSFFSRLYYNQPEQISKWRRCLLFEGEDRTIHYRTWNKHMMCFLVAYFGCRQKNC